jgi:hypothetical protein
MPLPKKLKIRGPEQGHCNICGNFSDLTYDHIPPKGCVEIKTVEIRSLSQHFYGKKRKAVISQNGVKFRTICSYCNNKLLGRQYDPELKKFTDEVSLFLRAKINERLVFPEKQSFKVKPQKLIRSIVGHILAGFVPEDLKGEKAPFPEALRYYLLHKNEPIPEKLRIFFWLYPVKNQIIIKKFGVTSIYNTKSFIAGSLIKFFPAAYLLVWEKPREIKIKQNELGLNKNLCLDDIEIVRINFHAIPRVDWPENPEEHEILMFDPQLTSYSKYRKI